jgi:excisionase family DNA binding protein
LSRYVTSVSIGRPAIGRPLHPVHAGCAKERPGRRRPRRQARDPRVGPGWPEPLPEPLPRKSYARLPRCQNVARLSVTRRADAVWVAREEVVAQARSDLGAVAAGAPGVEGAASHPTPWLSVQSAAERAGVSERSLERAIASGRLHSSTVGRRRLVHRDELAAYVRGGEGGEAPATPPRRLERV